MTTAAPIVHLIDDDEAFRTAIARILQYAGYQVNGYGSAGAFLLSRATRTIPRGPACIVLDLRLPGPGGLELQQGLAADEDALPIIFVSGHGDVDASVRAMKAGAVDFLTKPVERDSLLAAVARAITRDALRLKQTHRRRDLETRYATLLPREREVYAYVVAGRLNKQIADALGVAERTVKAHRAQVMDKMHAASLAELVLLAAELNGSRETDAAD